MISIIELIFGSISAMRLRKARVTARDVVRPLAIASASSRTSIVVRSGGAACTKDAACASRPDNSTPAAAAAETPKKSLRFIPLSPLS